MITNSRGTTISNDGATILKLLEIIHPAAKCLVDIAKSQVIKIFNYIKNFLIFKILKDNEVGDGTTTVTLLAGEFLKEAKAFVEEGMHS